MCAHRTFDSIRKSIQARGRPITLSFRNEYLSVKQRSILTKAVADVDSSFPLPGSFLQYRAPQNSSRTKRNIDDGSLSYQMMNQADDSSDAESSMTESATSPRYNRKYTRTVKKSNISRSWKSFSDAGSSSSTSRFASKFEPIMNNLVSSFKSKETITPGYMVRAPHFVESTKQHQDFRSSLL
jgi:hypothetical protein